MGKQLSSGPSESSDSLRKVEGKNDALKAIEKAKMTIIAATAYALAALNPMSSAQAAEPKRVEVAAIPGENNSIIKTSVGRFSDIEIDISRIPEGLQKNMKDLSDMISNAESRNLIQVKGGDFIGERTGINGADELGKVIPFIDRKEISLGNFKQLTGLNLQDVIASMREVIGNKNPNEIEASITGQFFKVMFADMIKNNPKMADTLTRTFENFGKKWAFDVKNGVLDEGVYAKYIDIFEQTVRELERRGLLSIDTLNLANRVAGGIAYQTSLKFTEGEKGETVFTGGTVNGRALQIAENKWKEGRGPLANDEAVRQLLINPRSRVIVYQVDIKYEGGESDLQYLLPISDDDSIRLSNQAIRHSVIGEKGKLANILEIAVSKQNIATNEREITRLGENISVNQEEIAKNQEATRQAKERIKLMDDFMALTKGRKLAELKPQLPRLIKIRDDYAKLPGAKDEVIAEYNEMISMLTN